MKKKFKFYALLLILIAAAAVFFSVGGDTGAAVETTVELLEAAEQAAQPTALPETEPESEPEATSAGAAIKEDSWYYTRDEVALYIHTYGRLPDNFVSKKDAEKAGWSGGSVEKVLPGMAIGGSRFGNYEGKLPQADGRRWTECDINTQGKDSRGAERIVFSNDGLIYYTADHYESFTLLYGEE